SRPNVKSIDSALVDAAIGGAALIGSLISAGIRTLAKGGQLVEIPSCRAIDSNVMRPAALMESQSLESSLSPGIARLPPLERTRLTGLLQMAKQPYRISDAESISAHIDQVL